MFVYNYVEPVMLIWLWVSMCHINAVSGTVEEQQLFHRLIYDHIFVLLFRFWNGITTEQREGWDYWKV